MLKICTIVCICLQTIIGKPEQTALFISDDQNRLRQRSPYFVTLTPDEAFNDTHWHVNFPQITELNIVKTDARTIPPLKGFPSLRIFKMVENENLKELPDGFFSENTKLTKIYLWESQHVDLPRNLFSGLLELKDVEIHSQKTPLPDDIFYNLPQLSIVALKHFARGTVWPNVFRDLKQLRRLHLSEGRVDIRWEMFMDLTNLLSLDLSRNQLMRITVNDLGQIPSLQVLNLSGNRIQMIEPDAFDGLPKLTKLILSDNKINSFDDSPDHFSGRVLGRFPDLIEIDLSRNQIRNFDKNVFRMQPKTDCESSEVQYYNFLKVKLVGNPIERMFEWKEETSRNGINRNVCVLF